MTSRVACIHGIGTSLAARAHLGADWLAHLDAGASHGLDVETLDVTWSSSGSPTRDLVTLSLGGARRWFDEVADQLDRRRCDVVLAHSLGSVLAAEAMRRLRLDVPLIVFGPPQTHPLWVAALHALGLRPAARAIALVNPDDGVGASRFLARGGDGVMLAPHGWSVLRVDVPFVPGHPFTEHAVEHYLRSRQMRDALMSVGVRRG